MKKPSFFTTFGVVVVLAATILLAFHLTFQEKTFPALSNGAHVGIISGLGLNPELDFTFYLEKLPDSSKLLVVAMMQGWQPQIVPLYRDYQSLKESAVSVEDIPYEPVTLKFNGRSYKLSGSGRHGTYTGGVVGEHGSKGRWRLEAVSRISLRAGESDDRSREARLSGWLPLKSRLLELGQSLEKAETALSESEKNYDRLADLIENKSELLERAKQRKELLRAEIADAKNLRLGKTKALKALVGELGLLGRITKRGKAVKLARKVAHRENKWYFANWRAAEDTSGLEEYLLEKTDIDPAQLEHELNLAMEKQTLLRAVTEEKHRIELLQEKLKPNDANEDYKKKKRRSFWDRVWGRK